MKPAGFSPQAARDLEEVFRHIAADNAEAAERVRQRIIDTADLLARHPELGRRIRKASSRHAEIRWLVVPKFRNYLIFYLPFQDSIMVIRVLHAARDWTRFFSATETPPA